LELNEKFEESQALQLLVQDLLQLNFPELADADTARFRIMFTNTESDREFGRCTKLDDPMRFLLKFDYIILIHKPEWDKMPPIERLRIVCHELRHIALDKGNPKIRKHVAGKDADGEHLQDDFCEIASRNHDKISYRLADQALERMKPLTKHVILTEIQKELATPA